MDQNAPPSASMRRRRWALRAGVGTAAIVVGASLIVLGPAGPGIAAHFAEGAGVWRLGKLHVEGVSGGGLGDLRVKRASLADADGVWAEADDLRLQWNPFALLLGQVSVSKGSIAKLVVLRQPQLAPAQPDRSGGLRLDANLPALGVADLELAEGVAGGAAQFTFAGAARTQDDAVKALHIDLKPRDNGRDRVLIDYRTEEKLTLTAAIDGAAGGVFAHLAGAPEAALHVAADAADGVARLDATLDRTLFASGALSWDERGWRGKGQLHLAALPAAKPLAERFGDALEFSGAGDALAPAGAPFETHVVSDVLDILARGRLDDAVRPVGAVSLALQAKRLAALAPELGLSEGQARLDGAIEFEKSRTRISGRLEAMRATRDGFAFSGEGPIEVFLTQKEVRFTGELGDREIEAPEFMSALMPGARLAIAGAFDRTNRAFRLSNFTLRSPYAALAGTGVIDNHQSTFSGTWDLANLGLLLEGTRGAARGRWTLSDTGDASPVLKAEGAARQFAGYAPFGAMLGPTPKLSASLRFTGGGTLVEYARAEGPRLRVGARGRLSGDIANLAIEASARGPADLGGASFVGAADATGTLTGNLGNPTLSLRANLDTLNVGGASLQHVMATLDVAPAYGASRGRVGLEGSLYGRPASAAADLSVTQQNLALANLEARWAQIVGKGSAEIADGRFSTQIDLSGALDGLAPGVSGALGGAVRYASLKDRDDLQMALALRGGRWGALAADEASVSLSGPLSSMKAQLSAKGWAGDQAVSITSNGDASVTDEGVAAQLVAQGAYAGAAIETDGPLILRVKDDVVEADGAVNLGGGGIEAHWRAQKQDVAITARFNNAPLEILTATMQQPTAGTLSGAVRLAGSKKSLGGDADLTFKEARLARRSRDAVDAHLTATLGGGLLRGKIDARSGRGLVANVEGQLPMVAEAAPFRLNPVQGGVLEANWRVNGPIEGLWAMFGPLDQELGGQVDGQGAVRFANGGVTGNGRLVISNGAFDDKFSGVKLRAVDAVMTFDENGASLERFSATDGKAGRISGSGRLNGQDEGKLDLKLSNVILADRPDAHAVGGGDIALEWRRGGVTLSGEIQLDQAEMSVLDSGPAAIPAIDVIEINRPGPPPRSTDKPASVIPARLDLRITAPGRIFTRTRGLQAEWAMDLRLTGDLAKPQLYGEARLVRGDFNLAGRRFDLETGVIKFAGNAEDAEIDLAASATSPELTVNVALTGRALDPQIALSSNPALPEDEILPELLFGRSSRDLNGFEAAQLAASLSALAGKSAFDIAGVARAAVNLDRLEVREDGGGVLVAGGKYLTRDVYVEVTGGALGRAGTAVEWQVRPRFYVISSFLTNGDQRIAVRWRQEY